VLKPRRRQPGERRHALPERQQERGHVVGPLKFALVEVVAPAERDHAPVANEPLELEPLERQRLHVAHQVLLVVG
jgi:hypothetical protein